MFKQLNIFLRDNPLYLLLLPFFFVWHGYVDFYNLISLSKAAVLIIYYVLGTMGIIFVFWFLFRSIAKASLFSFFVMCLYFFFGSLQDFLLQTFPASFVTKYSFILPFLLAIFILAFIYLKKLKKPLVKTTLFLNVLLFILIMFDATAFISKVLNKNNNLTVNNDLALKSCPHCPKPDIYLIVADEYAGKIALSNYFNFDNSKFENELRKRQFYVADSSTANYNPTVFSIGSLLNMDYLNTSSDNLRKTDLALAFKAIRNNSLMTFLRKEQYDIYNHSIFHIAGYPSQIRNSLMNFEKSPITTQTFLYRIKRDLGYHLINKLKLTFLHKNSGRTLFT